MVQSAGLLVRDKSVSDTADIARRDARIARASGAKFLVAIPPNSATVYPDELPIWARSNGRTTEYDLLLEDLAAHGVKTVDLRPVMSAARSWRPAYYLHDTHWTPRGALAGFNAIVEADSHPDWQVDPSPPWARDVQKGAISRGCSASRTKSWKEREFGSAEGRRKSSNCPRA